MPCELIATRGVEFSFNNQMYKQLHGVAMGSPLGPGLANIFVGFYESRRFDNTAKPGVYARYVDDRFVIFGSELDCDHFQEKLNLLHPALTFTIEKEQNNSLHFLNVLVEKKGTGLAFTGNQRLLGNTSLGIPLAQRQERLALFKL